MTAVANDGSIQTDAAIVNDGSITGGGALEWVTDTSDVKVTNNGVITLPTISIDPEDRSFVTVHNFGFDFIDQGQSIGTERVYAPTFIAGDRVLYPGIWNTEEDGTGITVTADTDLTDTSVFPDEVTPLYRQQIVAIQITATPSVVTQGQPVTLTATGTNAAGQSFDLTDQTVFTADQDDEFTGNTLTPSTPAGRIVTATYERATGPVAADLGGVGDFA